jgi:hypothetical protein
MPRLSRYAVPGPYPFRPDNADAFGALPEEYRSVILECNGDGQRLLATLERVLKTIGDETERQRICLLALLSIGMKMREESMS